MRISDWSSDVCSSDLVANRAECLTQNKTTGENEMVKMLIDGALVDGPRTMQVIDPSDETIAAEVPDATTADVDRAVAAAAKAFPDWRDSSPEARGAVLPALANVIIENADELGELLIDRKSKRLNSSH